MTDEREDFLSSYLQYASDTEVPAVFHRWSAIASVGAFLGRRYYLNHGHFTINPNIYCMLVGVSGTRKSTGIKLIKKLIQEAGYNTIAAEKTSKEKFLIDMTGEDGLPEVEDFLEQNLWGPASDKDVAEMFVMADEFNDFIGHGNFEFISLLGTLWDYSGTYRSRIKTGKSVSVNNPTVSILGGNTPTNISMAFPPEVIGQGFFSRLLFIYGEPNGKLITFPKTPSPESTAGIVSSLQRIRESSIGAASYDSGAEVLLDAIYKSSATTKLGDPRFESYSTRRLSHLLKLCLITSACRYSSRISTDDIIYANTILTHAEHFMPKALGEFGKARSSDVSHKIVSLIESTYEVLTFKAIWKHVSNDLEKMVDLQNILQNLTLAEKIQSVNGVGFLAVRKLADETNNKFVDYSLLTEEERNMKK